MIYAGNEAVSTTPVALCVVPSGPCSVTLSNGTATDAYVAPGSAVSAGNGFLVPGNRVVPAFENYAGAAEETLWAVTASGTATVGYLITTPGRYRS